MTSRCLHEIEFFSDLVISKAEAVFIGQSKEISRHGLGQQPPGEFPLTLQLCDDPFSSGNGNEIFLV
jgi:hypothetical protein